MSWFDTLVADPKVSDIHLSGAHGVWVRYGGELRQVPEMSFLSDDDTQRLLSRAMGRRLSEASIEQVFADVARGKEQDFALVWETAEAELSLRVNLFRCEGVLHAVLRRPMGALPSLAQLALPESAVDAIMRAGKGLVLVTGPTGSGKTTTLGALLQQRLDTSPEHLITLEDPIELALRASRGLVRQRELGRDFMDYPSAIRAALREDPDIVLVGEVRDQSTVSAAVQLADTGHLVFGTLHTRNATATVSRLINMVPSGERSALQTALGDVLVCILSQGLARRADGTRQLVSEVLMGTAAVRSNIAEGRTREIANNIAQGRRDGHRPWVGNLLELVRSSALTRQEALAMCEGDEVADFNEQYAGGSR